MTSILKAGWNLGKKVAITGAAISTAPVILPPLMVVSAMGFAFSVPSGLVLAGYVCNQKVMNYLLPAPDGFETFEEDYISEEEEGEEVGLDLEKDYMGEIDDRAELGDSTLADDAKEGDSAGWEQQSRVEETIDEGNQEGEKRKLPAGEEKNLYGDSFGSSGDDTAPRGPKQRTSETTYELKTDDNSRQDNGPLHVGVRKEEVLVRENGEGIKADNREIEGYDDSKKQEQVIVEERVIEIEVGDVGTIPPGGTRPVENITQEEEDKVEEKENGDRGTGKEAIILDIPIKEDKLEEPGITIGAEDRSSVSRTPEQDVATTEVIVVPGKASALKDQPLDEQTSGGDGQGLILGSSATEENHTETKREESIEVSHDEELYSEEEIWNQINALRAIVGCKGDMHDSFVEELKALYVFTGVEPPSAPDESSDVVQATENLRFLKTVIGVR